MRLVECKISLPYDANKRSKPLKIALLFNAGKIDLANGPFPGKSPLKQVNYVKKLTVVKRALVTVVFFSPS